MAVLVQSFGFVGGLVGCVYNGDMLDALRPSLSILLLLDLSSIDIVVIFGIPAGWAIQRHRLPEAVPAALWRKRCGNTLRCALPVAGARSMAV